MHQVRITITKRRKIRQILEIPSKWEEIPPPVVMKLVGLILSEMRPELQGAALRLVLKNAGYLRLMDDLQLAAVAKMVSWMWEEKITSPIIPWFKVRDGLRWTTYLLPSAKLENATCREWLLADEYFLAFSKSGALPDLDLLIATLCRQRNKNKEEALRSDDRRVKLLSRSEVEKRALKMKILDQRVKLFVLLFFSGCKEWVYKTYKPWLFEPEPEADEPLRPKTILDKLGWYGMFQRVAEAGIFGTMEDVLNTKFKDVCLFLVTKKAEYDEVKRMEREHSSRNRAS